MFTKKLSVLLFLLISSSALYAQGTSCDNSYNPLTNCSFEAGDFSGWTVKDMANPFQPAAVTGAGDTYGFGFFSTLPTDGSFVALNGFDGGGPDTIEYSQDVAIPVDAGELTFDYRAAWDMDSFCSGCTESRIFSVEVQPSGGGAALERVDFLMANPGENVSDTGEMSGSLVLDSYQGQTVRLVFLWTVPENLTGPAQFQLDNVNITEAPAAAPPPVLPAEPVPTLGTLGLLVLILVMLAFGVLSRRKMA